MSTKVSVIIVNYNSSDFLKECVNSLSDVECEIIVIDNASTNKEKEKLYSLSVNKLLFNDNNIGYASACNQGVYMSEGEYILFLNPDTIVFKDCIEKMVERIKKDSKIGAVGPKFWLDRNRTIQISLSYLITPFYELFYNSFNLPYIGEFLNRLEIKKFLYYWWNNDRPIKVNMLCGAAIMTTKKVLQKVGLFDTNFALYFEDTDWCMRLKKQRFKMIIEPSAAVCHFYNQSAKKTKEKAYKKFEDSKKLYLKKYFHPSLLKISKNINKLINNFNNSLKKDIEDIGEQEFSPVFEHKSNSNNKILFQISINPFFIPSAGSVHNKPVYSLDNIWKNLATGEYYCRFVDTKTLKTLKKWKFSKK